MAEYRLRPDARTPCWRVHTRSPKAETIAFARVRFAAVVAAMHVTLDERFDAYGLIGINIVEDHDHAEESPAADSFGRAPESPPPEHAPHA
jgi:hypothetical protein